MSLAILPLVGLGDVRFAMTYDEIREVLGEPHGYEDWMGGNLNGSMIYPKTLLHFDHCNSHRPTKHARIETIEGRPRDDLILWERPLAEWEFASLAAHCADTDTACSRSQHGELLAPGLRLSVSFGDDGHANWFEIESPWAVGCSTMRSDHRCATCGNSVQERAYRELHLDVFEEGMLRAAMHRNGLDRRLLIDVDAPDRAAEVSTRVWLWDLDLIGRREGDGSFVRSRAKAGKKLLERARETLLDSWICTGCGAWQ